MKRALGLICTLVASVTVITSSAFAVGGCSRTINLVPKAATSRGGSVIYKGNCDSNGNELSFGSGNHSQAGPAILFYYKNGLFPFGQSITAMNTSGKVIASGFRRPRCTGGCGQHERWYFGRGNARALKNRAPGGMIIKARNNVCVKVSNIYSRREEG